MLRLIVRPLTGEWGCENANKKFQSNSHIYVYISVRQRSFHEPKGDLWAYEDHGEGVPAAVLYFLLGGR